MKFLHLYNYTPGDKLFITVVNFQVSYFISAWARMCKIIGPGFVQYLPIVMGPLMQAASIKPEIAIVDCEPVLPLSLSLPHLSLSLLFPPPLPVSVYVLSQNTADTENNFNEDDGWEFVTLADQVILT